MMTGVGWRFLALMPIIKMIIPLGGDVKIGLRYTAACVDTCGLLARRMALYPKLFHLAELGYSL